MVISKNLLFTKNNNLVLDDISFVCYGGRRNKDYQKLQKEGESGRRKINNITRYLSILITGGQAPGYIANLKTILPDSAFLLSPGTFWLSSIIILVTGTMFVMWLGEKITD